MFFCVEVSLKIHSLIPSSYFLCRYPDATAEELAEGDNVCIICREEMANNCKKLPCNHIFHASCLRSWFQRQQTCPTCRMDVLRMPRPEPTPLPQDNQAEQQRQYGTTLHRFSLNNGPGLEFLVLDVIRMTH